MNPKTLRPLALRRVPVMIAVALVVLGLVQVATMSAQNPNAKPNVRIFPVQGSVYMIVGAGANIAAHIGDTDVLLVDTGPAEATDAILAALRTVTNKPIRYIINTSADRDHAGGNLNMVKAAGGNRRAQGLGGAAGGRGGNAAAAAGLEIFAHQNTANRLALQEPPLPDEAIPTQTFITKDKQIWLNGEAIEMWWHPKAHGDGDILVYFRKSDVLVAGEIYSPSQFPQFDLETGSLQGMLDGLNRIIDITVPEFNQMGGTRVIPGKGWLSTESDVVEARDMATIVRDRIRYMVDEQRMTLDQVSRARPTLDYDPVYAAGNSAATTKFVESVYKDLQKPREGPQTPSGLVFTDMPAAAGARGARGTNR